MVEIGRHVCLNVGPRNYGLWVRGDGFEIQGSHCILERLDSKQHNNSQIIILNWGFVHVHLLGFPLLGQNASNLLFMIYKTWCKRLTAHYICTLTNWRKLKVTLAFVLGNWFLNTSSPMIDRKQIQINYILIIYHKVMLVLLIWMLYVTYSR